MSLNIQNIAKTDTNQQTTNQKGSKLIMQRMINRTPNYEQTQRMFNVRNNGNTKKDLDIKQTERNYEQSRNKMIIWLTQSNQNSQKDSNWSPRFQSSSRKEYMDQIYTILCENNLAEVFQAFEQLRAIIMQETQSLVSLNKYRIELLQAIQLVKSKINSIHNNNYPKSSFSQRCPQQFKQMVKQVIALRAQNAHLKNRIQQIYRESELQKRQINSLSNSILNNSLSFHSYESSQSSNKSFEITMQRQLIRPFFPSKQIFQESTLNLFNTSNGEQQRQLQASVNCINEFAILTSHQQTQTCEQNQRSYQLDERKWLQVTQKCVQDMKKIFSLYVSAANLGLINNQHKLKQFRQLLQIHSYCSNPLIDNTDQFINQCKHFTSHIIQLSSKIDQIIQKSYQQIQTKCITSQ